MPGKKKKSQNEMNQLIAVLKNMAVQNRGPSGSKPKRKRKRRANGERNAISPPTGSDGSISLRRREMLTTVKLDANTSSMSSHVDLIPDSFSFLKGLSKSFDQLIWHSMSFYYKPAVGSTYGGLVSFGMDWDWVGTDQGRSIITSYTPSATMAAWQDTESRPMVLPKARLQARRFYLPNYTTANFDTRGPGKIHIAADGTSSTKEQVLGEVWVQYSVTMMGTSPT